MDFFSAQSRARANTKRLIIYFVLALLGICAALYAGGIFLLAQLNGGKSITAETLWNPQLALGTLVVFAILALIIVCAALHKWSQLKEGGPAVAAMMGGRRVHPFTADPAERRLLNVVEEMALASGVPVPPAFVLDQEDGINAFAAGLNTGDAVVAVSRGALFQLNRDELQAVVGHEFSHILNGDMRLNVRLTAIIFGLLVLTQVGRVILEVGARSSRPRKKEEANILPLIGLALIVAGGLGWFFGRLIQAAISRQREFLADASSVQFTRNPDAMASALNRIRTADAGSVIANPRAGEISHFFFAQSFTGFFQSMFATHPPLIRRILAVAPDFDLNAGRSRTRNSTATAPAGGHAQTQAFAAPTAAAFMSSVGTVNTQHVKRATDIREKFPPMLLNAARDPATASWVALGLLLDTDRAVLAKQASVLDLATFHPELLRAIATLDPFLRLPLLQIALGALHGLTRAQQDQLVAFAEKLIAADGRVTIFEYALLRILKRHIDESRNPRRAAAVHSLSQSQFADAASVILSFISHAGKSDRLTPAAAFASGVRALAGIGTGTRLRPDRECNFRLLDSALATLATTSPDIKRRVLAAAVNVAAADGVIVPAEAELLRAIAATLDCPVPPVV